MADTTVEENKSCTMRVEGGLKKRGTKTVRRDVKRVKGRFRLRF